MGRRHHWADDSGSADDRTADKTAGGPWSTGWQPTPAALNVGRERGDVHQPENKRAAGVYSFATLRRFRAANFCALNKQPVRGQ